jgi:hypothetical protein
MAMKFCMPVWLLRTVQYRLVSILDGKKYDIQGILATFQLTYNLFSLISFSKSLQIKIHKPTTSALECVDTTRAVHV